MSALSNASLRVCSQQRLLLALDEILHFVLLRHKNFRVYGCSQPKIRHGNGGNFFITYFYTITCHEILPNNS